MSRPEGFAPLCRSLTAAQSQRGFQSVPTGAEFHFHPEVRVPQEPSPSADARPKSLPGRRRFSRKHKLAKAKAEISKEEADSARLAQKVRQEVWTAYSRLTESFAVVATTDALVRDAQESLRFANERYKVGAVTIPPRQGGASDAG